MFFNKLLSNSRQILSKNVLPVKAAGLTLRQRHTVASPARTPISLAESITLGTLLTVSMWCIPAWVLYYIPDYQQENRYEYTGK